MSKFIHVLLIVTGLVVMIAAPLFGMKIQHSNDDLGTAVATMGGISGMFLVLGTMFDASIMGTFRRKA